MQVYNYHPTTGVFLGATEADESPLEPGVFLVPAFATTIVPPTVPSGQQAVFGGNSWSLQPVPEPPESAPPNAPVTPGPDFKEFLDLILVSNLYQSIVTQAASGNPVVNTGLTVTMGALLLAANGEPNIAGLQAGINLLFSGLTYTQDHVVELNEILDQSNLTNLVTIPQP